MCSQGEIRCKAPAEGDPVLATCPEENVNPEQDDMHRLVGCIPKILGSSSVRAPVSALTNIYIYINVHVWLGPGYHQWVVFV